MYRCFNNYFGYCKDKPVFDVEPRCIDIYLPEKTGLVGTLCDGTCKNDWHTCAQFSTITELDPDKKNSAVAVET